MTLRKGNVEAPVLKQKQRTAFPPNYVHSLDSTHLMMTALGCKDEGIAFAGVHDSFWTHPSHVDQLNRIIREKFVELHSQPLLHDLRDQFVMQYKDNEFPEVPTTGDLDLNDVLKSTYFFS